MLSRYALTVLIQQLGGAADISLMQSGMTHLYIFNSKTTIIHFLTDKTLLSAIFVMQEVLNAFGASLFPNFPPAQMTQG